MTRLREDGGFGNDSIREIQHAINMGPTLYRYDFTWEDSAALAAGIPLLSPSVGDILLDAWFVVRTLFDGTEPVADIGRAVNDYGIFYWYDGHVPLDASGGQALRTDMDGSEIGVNAIGDASGNPRALSLHAQSFTNDEGNWSPRWPGWKTTYQEFSTAEPLEVVAAQNNESLREAALPLDSTQGEASLYLLIASPVVLS